MLMELLIRNPKYEGKTPPVLIRSELIKHIRYSPATARTEITLSSPYEDREVIKIIPDAHFEKREEFLTKGMRKVLFITAEHAGDDAFFFAVNPARILTIKSELYRSGPLFTVSVDIDRLPPAEKKDVGQTEVGRMTAEETEAFQTGLRDYMFRMSRNEGIARTTALVLAQTKQ